MLLSKGYFTSGCMFEGEPVPQPEVLFLSLKYLMFCQEAKFGLNSSEHFCPC